MGYNPNVHIVHIFAVLMYTCAPVLLGLAVLDHLTRLVTHPLRTATLLVRGRGGARDRGGVRDSGKGRDTLRTAALLVRDSGLGNPSLTLTLGP